MKRKTKKIKQRERAMTEPINYETLDSIGSPNAWTPIVEDCWMMEVRKLSGGEIYRRFPPMKKPPSVRHRAAGSGWGG